jgi:hypothetical protein
MLRESIASQRRTRTSEPSLIITHPSSSTVTFTHALPCRGDLQPLSNAIRRAQPGSVQELVAVFNVIEVGGRPPVGGKAETEGLEDWYCLFLEIRDVSFVHPLTLFCSLHLLWSDLLMSIMTNIIVLQVTHQTMLTHVMHFLYPLPLYLIFKLPFEV